MHIPCLNGYRADSTQARYLDDGSIVEGSARYIDGYGDLAEQMEDILGAVFNQEEAALRLPMTWGS